MMGIPFLFVRAGIIPVFISIFIAWISSSLVATFLCDTISKMKGNTNFTLNITFSSACKAIFGGKWYVLAEGLFLLSCMIQACAGLVETAHAMDGFLAYFLLGRTFAIQFLPSVQFITWSPSECRGLNFGNNAMHEAYTPSDCTPFYDDGPLLFSLGFMLTTAIFMPLGLANLKETMLVQFISFSCLLLAISQFEWEFISRGFRSHVPWFGTDYSSLAGVILFNYAITLTLPSWLSEKTAAVNVNKIVWSATSLASVLYLTFGLMAALAFRGVTDEMLTILSSSKVHLFTRVYAALFGVIIIGGGVPVFCVVTKTALLTNKNMSPRSALFWGSIFPYAASWLLYQGSLLMLVLNWTGLLVNGVVAFILPLLLSICASRYRATPADPFSGGVTAPLSHSPEHSRAHAQDDRNPYPMVTNTKYPLLTTGNGVTDYKYKSVDVIIRHDDENVQNASEESYTVGYDGDDHPAVVADDRVETAVDPLPKLIAPYRGVITVVMIVIFAAAIVVTIGLNVFRRVLPLDEIEK